jgi:hypothetical protein
MKECELDWWGSDRSCEDADKDQESITRGNILSSGDKALHQTAIFNFYSPTNQLYYPVGINGLFPGSKEAAAWSWLFPN